jgi:DNA-directed RNA polymerase subunit RPC12/RpoP
MKKAYQAMGRKIRCEHCNSPKVIREIAFAIVQQKSPETGEPIGNKSLFFFYRCLSCDQEFYREDIEGYVN